MESFDIHDAHEITNAITNGNHIDHGWQKVSYPKRQRKTKPNADPEKPNLTRPNGTLTNGAPNVFRSLEQQSEDRRRRIVDAQSAHDLVFIEANGKAKHNRSDYEDDGDSSDLEDIKANGKPVEEKKLKQKKPKKPKVTVAEAAAKIDHADLSVYLDVNAENMINFIFFLNFVLLNFLITFNFFIGLGN